MGGAVALARELWTGNAGYGAGGVSCHTGVAEKGIRQYAKLVVGAVA